jgi:hypothetical protein
MLTITITTDTEGRITGLVVPRGAQAQIAADEGDAFASHFGSEGERFFRYDEDNDAGHRSHIPRGYRSRQGLTVYDLTPASAHTEA